jgi:hypothetical protein
MVLAIVAVVLSKGSATANIISSAAERALTNMMKLTMNPLAVK